MRQKYNNLTLAPFCCSHLSINEMIKVLLLCLLPHIIMLAVTSSIESLSLLFIIVVAAICSELAYNLIYKKGLRISWATLLQGVIIGLIVPTGYIPIAAFLITLVILFFERMIFMSFAQSWINTIALTVIVLYFVAPDYFPEFLIDPEALQQHNVGMKLFSDGLLNVSRFDVRVTNFLNATFFNPFGISVPEGYMTLFWDSQSVIPAFRFNVFTLIASMILFLTKTVDYVLPIVFLFVYAFLVYMFSLYPYADIVGNGDILLALFTGGTMFCAFFLIGWFGTAPLTLIGKIMYGIAAGILGFFICGAGTSTVGMVFVILVLNILCPIIQQIETLCYVSKLRKVFSTEQGRR